MHAALWRSRIYFRFFSKYPLTFSKIFVVFLSKNISWTKILNVRSISPINTFIIESVNELRLNPWDQIVAALPRVLRQFSARGLIQFLNHFHCTKHPHNLGARHGRMGTGIPAGGSLRYRKWVPQQLWRCSRHAAAVLSNKGVPQFWEM